MPSDREVLALALPALGALVAEPLYVLGDTAIIGHLGTVPLAGLALAGLLLAEILGFCTFLEYGTTARAARLYGAGRHEAALDAGVQATWLALGLGAVLVVTVELAAEPALHAMAGGSTPAAAQGLEWIRIAALGAPFVLITAAAQGWMRGFQDTRTPLYVIGAANLASIGLSAVLVFGLDLGIRGSAIANVVAQTASGAVALRPAGLSALAATLGHPIYWLGRKPGVTYELARTDAGAVFIRYLPSGVAPGTKRPYLTVATYPFPGALAAVKRTAARNPTGTIRLSGGGLAVVDAGYPKSIHVAYPGVPYQVEVFDPSPARARAVVSSGKVRALG